MSSGRAANTLNCGTISLVLYLDLKQKTKTFLYDHGFCGSLISSEFRFLICEASGIYQDKVILKTSESAYGRHRCGVRSILWKFIPGGNSYTYVTLTLTLVSRK